MLEKPLHAASSVFCGYVFFMFNCWQIKFDVGHNRKLITVWQLIPVFGRKISRTKLIESLISESSMSFLFPFAVQFECDRWIAKWPELVVLATIHTHEQTETNLKSKRLSVDSFVTLKFSDFPTVSTVLEARDASTATRMSWPAAFILAKMEAYNCDCADKVEERKR